MGFPVVFVIGLIVFALIAWGEYKEWHGQQQGKLMGESAERAKRIPLIEQECKRRDDYWLNVLRVHSIQAPQKVVLELGDGMEIRQKPSPRLPKS